jgi:hypothetical protein
MWQVISITDGSVLRSESLKAPSIAAARSGEQRQPNFNTLELFNSARERFMPERIFLEDTANFSGTKSVTDSLESGRTSTITPLA